MDPGIATITAAIIAAGTSVVVAWIVSRAPKRSVHEVWLRYSAGDRSLEDSRFFQVLRVAGMIFVGLMVFVGINLITLSLLAWMVPVPDGPRGKLLTALGLVSATLLFCIARWLHNRIKQPEDDDED
ncbi:MAG: hypothetical protein WDO17_07220 [Alphaproteobacteria bacterium]